MLHRNLRMNINVFYAFAFLHGLVNCFIFPFGDIVDCGHDVSWDPIVQPSGGLESHFVTFFNHDARAGIE